MSCPCPTTQKTRRALARRLRTTAFLAHGIAAHLGAMSVVNQQAEDSIGSRGIADLLLPARPQLRGEDGRERLIGTLEIKVFRFPHSLRYYSSRLNRR
jgi:hypothetical protein